MSDLPPVEIKQIDLGACAKHRELACYRCACAERDELKRRCDALEEALKKYARGRGIPHWQPARYGGYTHTSPRPWQMAEAALQPPSHPGSGDELGRCDSALRPTP